ncbi:MAG TPA: response regulator transcription factor [Candidatus Binatia bacterium]|nr:response regulator transcription factor [Candidatus Binatia bacterium]
MIRVLIADDHYLVRQGIRALLESAADMEVVGEAGDGKNALRLVEELDPDVVVMDISMPKMDGLLATMKLQERTSPPHVVMLSMYGNLNLVERAFRNGASGYLLKRSTARELVPAIYSANDGDRFLGSKLPIEARESLLEDLSDLS